MGAVCYQLRVTGLSEDVGTIRVSQLVKALGALQKTARRATSLLATGSGAVRRRGSGWLADATDFKVTGLKAGSTVFEVAALPLATAVPDRFAQRSFWGDSSIADDTPLDLAARAIEEAKETDPAGDWFDSTVLDAILEFPVPKHSPTVSYALSPIGASVRHGSFVLERQARHRIRKRLQSIPASRAFVVSGTIDEIKYPTKGFRLTLPDESHIRGRLVDGAAVESLRPLWGRPVTVEGMVHFKASGRPRLVEARKVMAPVPGDAIFRELPVADALIVGKQDRIRLGPADSINLDRIANKWPGDESIDELMEMID